MLQRLTLILFLAALVSPLCWGQPLKIDKDLDLSTIRLIPVLEGRRYKPFDSLAREWVRSVTFEEKFKKNDPVIVYLHWMFEPELSRSQDFIHLPSADAAATAGLTIRERKRDALWVSCDDLMRNEAYLAKIKSLRAIDTNKLNSSETEILRLQSRLNMLRRVFGDDTPGIAPEALGYFPAIPSKKAPGEVLGDHSWNHPWLISALLGQEKRPDEDPMTLASLRNALGWPVQRLEPTLTAFIALRKAFRANDKAGFSKASTELSDSLRGLDAAEYPPVATLAKEVRLNLSSPFHGARWIYILGTIAALVSLLVRSRIFLWISAIPLAGGLAFHAWGIWERTSLSQAMIGNYYESLLFFSAGCAALGLIMGLWFQARAFLIGGSTLAWLLITAAVDAPGSWDTSIETLQPVLINNYWIHIHVPTIILSYAALGLTVILGHLYLLRYPFREMKNKGSRSIIKNINRIMPVGVILIATGIVLGGVWADKSWGRFWGWDPKETWSFVTLLVFLIVVHGRWAGWLNDLGVALGTLVGGWSLFWTYWGANFYQKGLHSYAGATTDASIPTWLMISGGIEFLLFGVGLFFWFTRDAHSTKAIHHATPHGAAG